MVYKNVYHRDSTNVMINKIITET